MNGQKPAGARRRAQAGPPPHPARARAAIVITRLNIGGPAKLVTSLASEMTNIDTVILTGRGSSREGSMLDAAIAAGAKVVEVPGLRREISPLNDLRAFVWLLLYFRRHRPDIVSTHLAKAGALGRPAAWLAGVLVRIHTFHGHVLEGYFGSLVSAFYQTIERSLSTITTHFIAISPAVANQLGGLGIGRRKTSVIRIGFDLEPLRQHRPGHLRSDLGLSPGDKLVGVVGRLVPVKAHDDFLQAASLLAERREDIHFVIVGDGTRWDELHQLRDTLGLTDRVHFTGWRLDLPEVYSDLDVVICCSHMEGTPSTIIEAGAASRPVVGTRVGGLPDIITDGVSGLLVDSNDPPALAAAVERIIDDPDLAERMGREGNRLAFDRHAAVNFVAQTEHLYLNLIKASRP